MTQQVDPTFGSCYLGPEEYLESAKMFGLSDTSLPANADGIREQLIKHLSAASRIVDAKTNRGYTPGTSYDEQHKWDPTTRRVFPYNGPILAVTTFEIFTGPTSKATFPTNAIFINNSERWIELAALSAAGNLTSVLLTVGLYEPIVHIVYTVVTDAKINVKLATGYIAAAMMNRAFVDANMPPGIKSIKIGSQMQIERQPEMKGSDILAGTFIPPIVNVLLAGEVSIGIA